MLNQSGEPDIYGVAVSMILKILLNLQKIIALLAFLHVADLVSHTDWLNIPVKIGPRDELEARLLLLSLPIILGWTYFVEKTRYKAFWLIFSCVPLVLFVVLYRYNIFLDFESYVHK